MFRLKRKPSSGHLYKNVQRISCTEVTGTLQEIFSTYPSRKILIEYCSYSTPPARLINGYTVENTLCPFSIVKPTRCTSFFKFILLCSSILHVSDGFSIHHQESKTVHTASGIYIQILLTAC